MKFANSVFSFLLFALICIQTTSAQNTQPTLEDIERRMMEMQRRMMEQLRNSPFDGPNFALPQGDTVFQLRFDTTFEGGNMSQFFRFSPFGSDSTLQDGFFDLGRMFDQFFNLDGQFGEPDYGIGDFPKDDGDKPQTEDDLLPEERLRQQEESGNKTPVKPAPKSKSAEPKPDPRVKTIRI